MSKLNVIHEELLKELNEIRLKFSDRTIEDDARYNEIIMLLVQFKVYPEKNKTNRYTAEQMVDNYGVMWHVYGVPLNCPHCKGDLRDLTSGPPFKREIGIYSPERDITTAWQCPHCRKQWPRRMARWTEQIKK